MNKTSLKRVWHSVRLMMIPSASKRALYLKKHNVFHHMGSHCVIMQRKVPLYPKLISMGDNVILASNVLLVTHDATHSMLNRLLRSGMSGTANKTDAAPKMMQEKIGCICIGNNVFVGANTTILYDVNIGSRVIIGAGSVVTKDIPENSVAVGVPAKVIGTFDDYFMKRLNASSYPEELTPYGHELSEELEKWCWQDFNARHSQVPDNKSVSD